VWSGVLKLEKKHVLFPVCGISTKTCGMSTIFRGIKGDYCGINLHFCGMGYLKRLKIIYPVPSNIIFMILCPPFELKCMNSYYKNKKKEKIF